MPATISGDGTSTLINLTTSGNTVLGDASTDTLNVGNGGLVKDASGNVGIGTSSPIAKLQVAGGRTFLCANSELFSLGLQYNSSTGQYYIGATNSATPDLVFSNVGGAERMRLDTSGNLLVGTSSQVNAGLLSLAFNTGTNCGIATRPTNNAGYDAARFFNSSTTQIGNIACTTTNTSYVTSSDYRLKENIAPMIGALAVVAQLKPCTYNWKSDGSNGEGFIAHELAEVCPDAVTGEKDAINEDGSIKPQGIDTSFLVATLTAAIQELKAIVDAQAVEIAALKGTA